MRKNGFTLIELLAVIVILAIIALIATPIILGIINDAREKSNERSVELYASAVKNGIAAYQLVEGKEVEAGTYTKETLPFEVEYDGKVECTSVIISEDGKVSLDKCTVNGGTKEYSYGIKKEEIGKACTLDDKDGNGVASLNDIVTCGTESFNVMYNENNEITMLSKYNLYVGNSVYDGDNGWEVTPLENPTGIQSAIAQGFEDGDMYRTWYGTVSFSTESYWTDENDNLLEQYGTEYPAFVYNEKSNLYPYVSEYERILKEDLKVSSATATLISYEQFIYLEENNAKFGTWEFYWTGSACSAECVMNSFYGDDDCISYYDDDFEYGVRPVITISTSEIQ